MSCRGPQRSVLTDERQPVDVESASAIRKGPRLDQALAVRRKLAVNLHDIDDHFIALYDIGALHVHPARIRGAGHATSAISVENEFSRRGRAAALCCASQPFCRRLHLPCSNDRLRIRLASGKNEEGENGDRQQRFHPPNNTVLSTNLLARCTPRASADKNRPH